MFVFSEKNYNLRDADIFRSPIPAAPNPKELYHHLTVELGLAMGEVRRLQAANMPKRDSISCESSQNLGQHLLAEFLIPTPSKRWSALELEKVMIAAANKAKATILKTRFFEHSTGNGVSGIVVVAESHFTLHYFRGHDYDYAAFDAYTCGNMDFLSSQKYLQDAFQMDSFDEIEMKRGILDKEANNFIPGIALKKASQLHFFKQHQAPASQDKTIFPYENFGNHAIGEFYYCNSAILNRASKVLDIFADAVEDQKAAVKFADEHTFSPQGVSAVVLGDGYHITVHNWPEYEYAPVDVCAFNNVIDARLTAEKIAEGFRSEKTTINEFKRGNLMKRHVDQKPEGMPVLQEIVNTFSK